MITENSVASETITINAPAQLVWDVIVDFENYPLWNRFCPGASGTLALGEPLTMQVDLGNGPQEQVEYFTVIEPPHRIVWSMENKPGDPVHADRAQVITPLDEHSCTYVTVDEFAGEAVPQMMEAMAEAVERGFNLCARCLKERAEALYSERSGAAG
ncbi:MAG: SRPBCC domain-containing protein [Halioglobus sp.]|nr:SRPBCC domain-containing protein [Halioglobus sp.]